MSQTAPQTAPVQPRRHSRWRRLLLTSLAIIAILSILRAALPQVIRWYINRALDRSLLYHGEIGRIDVHLWRGAYTINDIRLQKVMGNVPVPFYAAKRVDLAIDSDALIHRRVVGRITMYEPELNFVASEDQTDSQTGAGTPWLQVIKGLFPFKINSARIVAGSIHFHAFHSDPPVDVYLSHVQGTIDDLTNIRDETTPMISTMKATALAMEQARVEFQMKMDPFAYRPTFQLAVRLIGLDVTKVNALTEAYGKFTAQRGWFDLVVQLTSQEGQLSGYVKPLFRQLQIFSPEADAQQKNPIEFIWQGIVGIATQVFKNQQRDQFGTMIPFHGDIADPQTNILTVVGNVLQNAFIRAYLPRFEAGTPDINGAGIEFDTGSIITDPNTSDDQS